jgi:hypothetical protein
MDSETSSTLILVAIVAAAILVPLVLIGAMVLIFLPVVRRRRRQWQTNTSVKGLCPHSTSCASKQHQCRAAPGKRSCVQPLMEGLLRIGIHHNNRSTLAKAC